MAGAKAKNKISGVASTKTTGVTVATSTVAESMWPWANSVTAH